MTLASKSSQILVNIMGDELQTPTIQTFKRHRLLWKHLEWQ